MDGVWAAMPVSRLILFVLLLFIWYLDWPGGLKNIRKD